LRKLYHILQAAFGWHDAHLHEFEILCFVYKCDFGDCWDHDIVA
jgi:hypothetical protein